MRKVLGWVVTVLMVLMVAAITIATEAIKPSLTDSIDLPGWLVWFILGILWACLAAFLGLAVIGPGARARRREVRERRRKLSNFDLD